METFNAQIKYWEMPRRVRETFARSHLADLLHTAFDREILKTPHGDLLEDFVRALVVSIEPTWVIDEVDRTLVRAEITQAFEALQSCAQAIASNRITPTHTLTVRVSVPAVAADRDGHPRTMLQGRLADALVWAGLKLFSEVPRSLIRACDFEGCSRIYVAIKNQKFCRHHQREAHRQTQRRAEAARRDRQRTTKKTTKNRRGR